MSLFISSQKRDNKVKVRVIYLIGLMLTVLKPISETFCRLNSNVAFQEILMIFSNDNFSHLEIFHVMLQGDFKAIVGRIEVVWNGHWVKHSYSWRPSNLQGEVSLCHGVCSSNTIHTLYSTFLNHQYLISVARLFCTVYSGNSYVWLPT